MKYYSDILDQFFDSEDECNKAEYDALEKSKKAMERADREIKLKALRKDVTRLRQELDCALEKFYAAQHEYFNDYNRLYPSVETEETEETEEIEETEETEDKTNSNCNYCDYNFGRLFSDRPVSLDVELVSPLKECYPHLWDLFYGGN